MPLDILFSTGLHALFYIVTLLFVFYTVCIAFHWLSYGSSKSMSMLSMAIYLIVSAPLFLAMALVLTII